MSDLTWTEMPEVNPEQPDELVLDFSGEIYRVAPADTFVIGRGGDLDIDDNPYLHRRFLVFELFPGLIGLSPPAMPARTTFGPQRAAVPCRASTWVKPKAAALRSMEPVLPASCTRSSTRVGAPGAKRAGCAGRGRSMTMPMRAGDGRALRAAKRRSASTMFWRARICTIY